MFKSYTGKRRGRKETEVARRIKGGNQKERQIQPVISSLSVIHRPEHTKRFTEKKICVEKRRGREEIEVTTFQREWAAFLSGWCPLPAFRSCFMEFVQHSNDFLMNLWGRKWSPHPVPLPS